MAKGDILLMYDLDGEIPHSEISKFYAALEACIGAVLMALFVLSVARKTAR